MDRMEEITEIGILKYKLIISNGENIDEKILKYKRLMRPK